MGTGIDGGFGSDNIGQPTPEEQAEIERKENTSKVKAGKTPVDEETDKLRKQLPVIGSKSWGMVGGNW